MMLIDPDYARIYTKLRIQGWQYGWAVVLHGSNTRDLDLLMVPWDEHCVPESAERVLKMFVDSEKDAQGQQLLRFRFQQFEQPTYKVEVDWSPKPFGRKATSLFFRAFGDPRWVDVSVCPHSMPKEVPSAVPA